jgi:hypothetical protein
MCKQKDEKEVKGRNCGFVVGEGEVMFITGSKQTFQLSGQGDGMTTRGTGFTSIAHWYKRLRYKSAQD